MQCIGEINIIFIGDRTLKSFILDLLEDKFILRPFFEINYTVLYCHKIIERNFIDVTNLQIELVAYVTYGQKKHINKKSFPGYLYQLH